MSRCRTGTRPLVGRVPRRAHHARPGPPHSGDQGAPSAPQTGVIGAGGYEYGSTRLARSVLRVRSMHRKAIHPTEKPVDLLDPLIRYGCPPGGLVIDPCAGSGSTGAAARAAGRRALLVEVDEAMCEAAARRLADPLQLGPDV
jgi:site-specific DNA-methyltransferase (adenine-specific)